MLDKLVNACGTSGFEAEVRDLILAEIRERVAKRKVDALGNLIAKVSGREGYGGPRLLLSAHMDEVGMAVAEVNSSGGLKFFTIGGIDDRVLPSKRVWVGRGDKRIPGVIGLKSPHLHKSRDEMDKVIKADDLYVDIGASKKEEAEKLAGPGEPIHFATEYFEQAGRAFGKAFDDRAGCAIIASMILGAPELTGDTPFFAAFTVQEEVGLRGGRVAGYATDPDVFIAVEGTTAGDGPAPWNGREVTPSTELGRGPAISLLDRSHIADQAWLEFVLKVADEEGIPHQFKRSVTGGTESGVVHRSRTGVRAVTIAVPVRYIHSPVGVLDKQDYENTKALIAAVIRRLEEFKAR